MKNRLLLALDARPRQSGWQVQAVQLIGFLGTNLLLPRLLGAESYGSSMALLSLPYLSYSLIERPVGYSVAVASARRSLHGASAVVLSAGLISLASYSALLFLRSISMLSVPSVLLAFLYGCMFINAFGIASLFAHGMVSAVVILNVWYSASVVALVSLTAMLGFASNNTLVIAVGVSQAGILRWTARPAARSVRMMLASGPPSLPGLGAVAWSFPQSLVPALLSTVCVMVVDAMSSSTQAGIFRIGVSVLLAAPMLLPISVPITQSRIVALVSSGDYGEASAVARSRLRKAIVLSGVVSGLSYFLLDPALRLLLGNEFTSLLEHRLAIAVGVFGMGVLPLASAVCLAMGFMYWSAMVLVCGALVSVAAIFYLFGVTPSLGTAFTVVAAWLASVSILLAGRVMLSRLSSQST